MWKKGRLYGSHRLQFSSKETSIQSGITKLMLQHLWSDPHEPSHEPTKGQYMKIASLYICYLPLHTIRSLLFQVGNESYTSYQAERENILASFSRSAEVGFVVSSLIFAIIKQKSAILYWLLNAVCFFSMIIGHGVWSQPPRRSDLHQGRRRNVCISICSSAKKGDRKC
jgi:hypothetical protein